MVKVTRPYAPRPSRVDTPSTQAPATQAPATRGPSKARPPSPATGHSSMAAARPAGPRAPARQQVEQQLAGLAEGPIRQALLHSLSGALAPALVGAAARAIGAFAPAQQQKLAGLLSKAGQSPKASPRADAAAERAFLLKAVAEGAVGATLERLANQIRGRPPSNQALSFNPLTGGLSRGPRASTPADAAAVKLKEAMDDRWGTDEAAVFEALEGTDPALLPQVAQKYEKLTGMSLRQALELEFEGPELQRARAAFERPVAASATAKTHAPAKTQAATWATAAEVKRHLDAIQVSVRDEGVLQRGNAVELNELIPVNVATWKPPKAQLYKPLKQAVSARNAAHKALEAATTEPARQAARAKLEAADERVAAEGEKVKAWLRKYMHANPELKAASAAVKKAEALVTRLEKQHKKAKVPKDPEKAKALARKQQDDLNAARATLTGAQGRHQQVKQALEARIDAYAPMVDVPQHKSRVTVDGVTVEMRDGRETPYTNSWGAVDGGAVRGDSRAIVDEQLDKSGISEDRRKILSSISGLEGTFSKVNTWDTGRVSWGFTQWTLGKSGNGTLADFMRHLKKTDAAQYEKGFGRYGLDIDSKGVVLTRADGTVLKGVAAAEALRTDVKLAAVFMAAGADPAMQQAQIRFANEGKISATRGRSVEVTGKDTQGEPVKARLRLGDVVTSEYGNAIMTDLAVNAGSGGKVAATALAKYVKDKGVDPGQVKEWGPDAEKAIIAALEHASRAERLAHHRKAGFSREPHSFTG